jgi:cytochrome b6
MREWFSTRIPLEPVLDFLRKKTVPQHRHSFWYIFGGLTLFFFIIQIITGILLLFYYSPTPDTAHESVQLIMTKVPFGWLVRSIHSWSANLMVAAMLVHLFSTFLMRAYRKPREILWISGVLQLFMVLGFAFTGYLLPWDTTAYFATKIGTEIPMSTPILGQFVVNILRGGDFVGAETLKRLFALHVVALPIVTLGLVSIHLILNQVNGTSSPIGIKHTGPGISFYPNYIYRDAITWALGAMVLATLVLLLPVNLGPKANPYSSAPSGIHPEWYFMSLFQTLKVFPAQILGISGDTIVNVIVGLVGFLLLGVPFLDRKASREEPNSIFTALGVFVIIYLAGMTAIAYLTLPK